MPPRQTQSRASDIPDVSLPEEADATPQNSFDDISHAPRLRASNTNGISPQTRDLERSLQMVTEARERAAQAKINSAMALHRARKALKSAQTARDWINDHCDAGRIGKDFPDR